VRLGVEGKPGPHNFLEYVAPLIYPHSVEFGYTFVMHPNMAKSLYDYGFKKKADIYQWLYDTYYITVGDFRGMGDWDFLTSGGTRTIPGTTITYNAAGNDYKIHAFGGTTSFGPKANCVIVSIGGADEICWAFSNRPTAYPIDPWR
jgi:hypothetical protein